MQRVSTTVVFGAAELVVITADSASVVSAFVNSL
jgi:hypothetical protein